MLAAALRATLALAVALAGCPAAPSGTSSAAGSGGSTRPSPAVAVTPIPDADRLFATSTSGYEEPTQLVVRDRAAWEAAWSRLHGGQPAAPAPAVDFARDVVVVVAMGTRGSGGHAVRTDGVSASGDAAVVRVALVSPGPSCMTTQAITTPAEAVRVRRPAGDVRIETRAVTTPC